MQAKSFGQACHNPSSTPPPPSSHPTTDYPVTNPILSAHDELLEQRTTITTNSPRDLSQGSNYTLVLHLHSLVKSPRRIYCQITPGRHTTWTASSYGRI